MTNIIINGANGKMGQEAVKAVSNAPQLSLVAQTDVNDNLAENIKQHNAAVVVDLTHLSCVFENCKSIFRK